MRAAVSWLSILFFSAGWQVASAQTTAAREPSRLTLAGGVLVAAGYGNRRRDRRDASQHHRRWPHLSRSYERNPGWIRRWEWTRDSGVALNRLVGLELGGAYFASAVAVTISQDAEVPGATAHRRRPAVWSRAERDHESATGAASRLRPYLARRGRHSLAAARRSRHARDWSDAARRRRASVLHPRRGHVADLLAFAPRPDSFSGGVALTSTRSLGAIHRSACWRFWACDRVSRCSCQARGS